MRKIDVLYNSNGYIEDVADNSIHIEQENQSLLINATINTDKKVRAYIKAPNGNSTVTDELTPADGVYSCTVSDAYMSKGTLYVGYELYDDTGYIERLEPLKIYIDSFISLGTGNSDNVYVVTVSVGEVETVDFEESAKIENVGTKKDMVLNFKIPRGEKGEKGEKGDKGEQGVSGKDGADGYTPIKGIDYFTPEDIANLGIDDKVDKETFYLTTEDLCHITNKKVDKVEGKDLSQGRQDGVPRSLRSPADRGRAEAEG